MPTAPALAARRLTTILALGLLAAGTLAARPCGAQMLETESARLLPRGWWKFGGALEAQTSGDGREGAVPMLVEFGITDRLELAVEPVPWTVIRPVSGRRAYGPGDVEATLTWRFGSETPRRPALAIAGEIKLPTARDSLIGTGQSDLAAYLIGSKRFGRLDVHANVSYTFVGSPTGATLDNIMGAAAAVVYSLSARSVMFAEVLANTSAGGGEPGPGATTVIAEAAGGEIVGSLGLGRTLTPALFVYAGLSYDNNAAVQLRTGLTLRFHPFVSRPVSPGVRR